jgi:hypothetical protein
MLRRRHPRPQGISCHLQEPGRPSAQYRRSSGDGSAGDRYEFLTEGFGLFCSRTHNMQANQYFYFICSSGSLAMGSPLLYNAKTYSTSSRKMALKCITACPLGGVFASRGKSGLCAIPIKSAYTHVRVCHSSGLAKRNMHTSCKRPLQQTIGGYVGPTGVMQHSSQ